MFKENEEDEENFFSHLVKFAVRRTQEFHGYDSALPKRKVRSVKAVKGE